MEKHYTYIIFSESFKIYYKGYSTQPLLRLDQHNRGESSFTAGKGPWKLVFIKQYPSKKEALIAEKKIMKAGTKYLQEIIHSKDNLINRK